MFRREFYGDVPAGEPAYIRDIGLGKETKFKYPWNPQNSPSMCEEAQIQYDTIEPKPLPGEENYRAYWNWDWKYLGPDCNEFIFSKV